MGLINQQLEEDAALGEVVDPVLLPIDGGKTPGAMVSLEHARGLRILKRLQGNILGERDEKNRRGRGDFCRCVASGCVGRGQALLFGR
jgi:hypothetical protein